MPTDPTTGAVIVPPSLAVANVRPADVALSPDGLKIYAAGADGFVRVYNAETGEKLATWDVGVELGGLDVSPDGRFLVVVEREPISEKFNADYRLNEFVVAAYRVDTSTGAVGKRAYTAKGLDHVFFDVAILDDNTALLSQSAVPGWSTSTSLRLLNLRTGVYTNEGRFRADTILSDSRSGKHVLFAEAGVTGAPLGLYHSMYAPFYPNNRNATYAAGGANTGVQAFSDEVRLIAIRVDGAIHIFDSTIDFGEDDPRIDYRISLAAKHPSWPMAGVSGLAFDASGKFLFVLDTATDRIVQLSTSNWSIIQSFPVGVDLTSTAGGFGNNLMVGADMRFFTVITDGGLQRVDNPALPDALPGTSAPDTITGTAQPDILLGFGGDDQLTGGAGKDALDGGTGADTMRGGADDDNYFVDTFPTSAAAATDLVIEVAGAGVDTVNSSVSYILPENVEKLVLIGTAAAAGTGNDVANSLTGNKGANRLDGGKGADTMAGGLGDDTYVIDAYTPSTSTPDDVVVELAASGVDTIEIPFTYTLGAHIENLRLTGSAAIDATGNGLVNRLTGNGAANRLDGMAGADTMAGGLGDDVYVVDTFTVSVLSADDVVVEATDAGLDTVESSVGYVLTANVEDLVLTGTGAISGTGNALANRLKGNSGANRLDGKEGADTMTGGLGDDTYVVDTFTVSAATADDNIVEAANGGADSVESSVSYLLGANVENLLLIGTAAIDGTGNGLANNLTGNSGANRLDGKGGADKMTGGLGNDTYVIDTFTPSTSTPDDVVVELAGGGSDTVEIAFTYTLGDNVENLVLTGTAAIDGTGNGLANRLTGNGVANVLDGAGGVDTLVGGKGDDTYVVDNSADVVKELDFEGVDIVKSSADHSLHANVEALLLTGSGATNGTGNGLVNHLTGNNAANRLNGMAGADTMIGGAGNDTYVVDTFTISTATPDDLVVEAANGGVDTVESSITYVLPANVENILLTGTGDTGGTGNALVNNLRGNSGANRLDGGAGADVMKGGAGDDVYVVDSFSADPAIADDTIVEAASGGFDTVESAVSYTLGAELEALILTGGAVRGTGNNLANRITGNAAANQLFGGSGADILRGAAGADTLDGEAGNDRLDGGLDADTMAGGLGNDTYVVDHAGDAVIEAGSSGTDTVESSVGFTLPTDVEKLVLTGNLSSAGRGNAGANTITGNSGGNFLNGGGGDDRLDGGAGNDRLVGDAGNDMLTGGAGSDRFEFTAPLGSTNVDKILDFSVPNDTIQLARSIFATAGANGTLGAAGFHKGTAAADESDRIIYDAGTGRIFYDADGTGAEAQLLFATVAAGTALTQADFVIYG